MKLRNAILSVVLSVSCLFAATGCKKNGSSVGNVGEITFADGDKIAEIVIEDYGTIRAKLFTDIAPIAVKNFTTLAEQGYYNGLKIHRVIPDNMIQGGSLNGDGTGGKAPNEAGYFNVETNELARNFYGALGFANVNGKNTTQFYIVNNKKPIDITQYNLDLIKQRTTELGEQLSTLDSESSKYEEVYAQHAHFTKCAEMLEKASAEVWEKYKAVGGIPHWDGGYTVFGQVYEGFDVLDKISECDITENAQNEISKPVSDIIITQVNIIEYKTPETAEAETTKKPGVTTAAPEESKPEDSDAQTGEASKEGTAENSDGDTATVEVGE